MKNLHLLIAASLINLVFIIGIISFAPTPPSPAATTSCIVTVDGVRYDVTVFRQIHSGGDIFQCGTDMSQTFWEQHNREILDKMAKYKI